MAINLNATEVSDEERQIEILIRSGYPIIYLYTSEEQRAIQSLRRVAGSVDAELFTWTVSEGVKSIPAEGASTGPGAGSSSRSSSASRPQGFSKPREVLQYMIDRKDPSIFVLLDFHPYMKDPDIIRKLRDVVTAFRQSFRTLILLSPVLLLPVELEKDITLVEYSLPTAERLRYVLERIARQARENKCEVELNEDDKERLVKAMQGLTESQAENVLAKAVVVDNKLNIADVDLVHREKEQIIRKSGILEFYSSPEDFKGIGGLLSLKEWFRKRKDAFTDRAHAFGLPAPKGILLLGVPGCGKSLCAKSLAAEWDKPLLRFDVGRIFGHYVGDSESNMRAAIQVAESIAPAILWIDEIEKGFAGMQGRGDGGGVVSRVFGTLITWMQEKTAPVFVVATANDISQLPPEMLRKGRFDELFFVDLPFPGERKEIFQIHLQKRKREPTKFDLGQLASATEGFSGAEIEQVVISALYDAFDAKEELSSELLLKTSRQMQPLSKTMAPQINALRRWAADRCRYAANEERREASGSGEYEETNEGFVLRIPRTD